MLPRENGRLAANAPTLLNFVIDKHSDGLV